MPCAILHTVTTVTKIERSGPAIRAVLRDVSPAECAQFEQELASALARAATELDLRPADEVLDRWWGIAAIRMNPLGDVERKQLARARSALPRHLGRDRARAVRVASRRGAVT